MAVQTVRFDAGDGPRWGVHREGRITPLEAAHPTTRAWLLEGGADEARARAGQPGTLGVAEVDLLSPVTSDGAYICQGLNYASHLAELGRDPAAATDNVLFMKSSACISPPDVDIVRPPHVQVLDYENELGLVLGADVDGPLSPTEATLHRWIAGFVMTDDVSARDDQVAAEQFHKAKSYRTFGPTGPFLVLVDAEEAQRWGELVIRTRVNGELRQDCPASDMVFGPVATLRELSAMHDLRAGDLIATGTPAGMGMAVPHRAVVAASGLLPKQLRMSLFLKTQARSGRALQPGDRLELTIATPDGAIDLGRQSNQVVQG